MMTITLILYCLYPLPQPLPGLLFVHIFLLVGISVRLSLLSTPQLWAVVIGNPAGWVYPPPPLPCSAVAATRRRRRGVGGWNQQG